MYTISLINLLSNPVKQPQTSLQSMDSEREKFRTYIEKTGVMSALTDALVQLYEEQERPSDALGHIKKTLGSFTPSIQHCHMLEEKVTGQKRERERGKGKDAGSLISVFCCCNVHSSPVWMF